MLGRVMGGGKGRKDGGREGRGRGIYQSGPCQVAPGESRKSDG